MKRASISLVPVFVFAMWPAFASAQTAPAPAPASTQQVGGVPIYTTPAPTNGAPAAAPASSPAPQPAEGADKRVRTAENAVFLELGGSGLVYSVNYERLFGDSDFSLRAGFSYMSLGASGGGASSNVTLMTFPVLGNYYIGGKNHKLQLGAGATIMYAHASAGSSTSLASVSGLVPAPTVAIGYRYIPAKGGFTFFIGLTPFIIPGGDKPIFPWGGMSFGGVF